MGIFGNRKSSQPQRKVDKPSASKTAKYDKKPVKKIKVPNNDPIDRDSAMRKTFRTFSSVGTKKAWQNSLNKNKKILTTVGKNVGNVGFAIARNALRRVPGVGTIINPYLSTLQTDMNNGNINTTKYMANHPEKYFQKVAKEAVLSAANNVPIAKNLANTLYESTIHGNYKNVPNKLLQTTIKSGLNNVGMKYGSQNLSERLSNTILHGNPKQLTKNYDRFFEDAAKDFVKEKAKQSIYYGNKDLIDRISKSSYY